jgi:hypothetical protein
MMMAQLAIASWETIFYRSILMANGTCTAAEFRKMGFEKAEAATDAAVAFMMGKGEAAILAPYLSRARANANRLRDSVTM